MIAKVQSDAPPVDAEAQPVPAKGFWHARMGWVFQRELTNAARFGPDLLADDDIRRVNRWFPALTAVPLLAPALAGGLITWSSSGAPTAFFRAGLLRVAVLHHVTWSVNSICHTIGDRPFAARDRSADFRPPALLSMGDPVDGRVLAQLPPRRPHLRAPRCPTRPGRRLRTADPGLRGARLGHHGPPAEVGTAGPRPQDSHPLTATPRSRRHSTED
ncbi:hypothetical protein J2S66_002657 [Saccharothrix longispora]|uniref:Uncharacterized protein n=1 Tax=Saccharothrix longispora TaxID=33920 RepID=A0ABU1PUF5_9PSEU|nr:hypothetical protein [Saccharothrix longispora]